MKAIGFIFPFPKTKETGCLFCLKLYYITLLEIFARILLKKKKSVLTSTLLYCSKSMQHSARSSWVSQLQIGICFIIYSLTSQCVWLWKKTSLYNYYHFWISNDWRTQKACKSCYYGQRDEYLLGHLVTGSYICIQKNLNSPYLNWWKHDNSLWQLRVCSGLQSIVILVVILIQTEDVDGCILFSSHGWIIF